MGTMGMLYSFIYNALRLLVLYVVIRLAVKHGIQDANKNKTLDQLSAIFCGLSMDKIINFLSESR